MTTNTTLDIGVDSTNRQTTNKVRVTIMLDSHFAMKLHRLSFGRSKGEVVAEALMLLEATDPLVEVDNDI